MPHCDTVDCKHYTDNGHDRPVRVCTPRDPCPLLALKEPQRKWCYFDDSRGRPLLADPIWTYVRDALRMVRNAGQTPHVKSENDHECTITCY